MKALSEKEVHMRLWLGRTQTGRRLAVAVLLATSATVALALPAEAGTVDTGTSYAAVRGRIDVVNDTTTWDMTVSKVASFSCVYAKVALDLSYPHREYESERVCVDDPGRAVAFRDTAKQYRTRGANVLLCLDLPSHPDHCELVWHEPARWS